MSIAFLSISIGFAGSTFLGAIVEAFSEDFAGGFSSSCFVDYKGMAAFSLTPAAASFGVLIILVIAAG